MRCGGKAMSKTGMTRRTRDRFAPGDERWFDETCRRMALHVCRGRPALFEDAEAEARLNAWDAYRKGCAPPSVAFAARVGAADCLNEHVGRLARWDPETGRRREIYGHRAPLHDTAPLLLTSASDGTTYDHPGLPAQGSAEAEAVGRVHFEWLLGHLPGRESDIVRRYVAGGETFWEIAGAWEISEARAYQLYRQALARLRRLPGVAVPSEV